MFDSGFSYLTESTSPRKKDPHLKTDSSWIQDHFWKQNSQEQLWVPTENVPSNFCQNLEGTQTNVPTWDPNVGNLWPIHDSV